MAAAGYGIETFCLDSLKSGRFVSGPMVVVQALCRRLRTRRGTLRGVGKEAEAAAIYGFDVCEYIGAVGYPTALAALPGFIRAELSKDDRVTDVTAKVTETRAPDGAIALLIECEGTLLDEEDTFRFTALATDLTLTLLGAE